MTKYKCVMQEGMKDCGICALLTIMKSYGGNVSKEYLRRLTNTTQNGVNAYSLLEAGRKLGFDTKGVKGEVFDIEDRFLPCIAHVIIEGKYKHFVVIHKIDRKNKSLIIADPAHGIIKMNFEQFNDISTRNFLFFTPNKCLPTFTINNKIKDIIWTFFAKNKKVMISIVVLSIMYTIVNIITSFYFQFVLEKSLYYNSKSNLYFIFIVVMILFLFKAVMEYLRNHLLNFINHKLDYLFITKSFRHILSLPHLYYKNRTTGDILSRVNDLGEIRDTLSRSIITFSVDFILVFFVLIFLFSISATLSWISLIIISVYMIVIVIFNRLLYHHIKIIKEKESRVNSNMIESINAIDSIKGMNMLEEIMNNFTFSHDQYLKSSYQINCTSNIEMLLGNILSYSLTGILTLVGGILVLEDQISLGSVITYNSLIYYFLEPLKNVTSLDILWKRAKIIVERINEVLNIEDEKLLGDVKGIEKAPSNITIQNLTYSYNGRDPLLTNFSLNIQKGEKIVICGASGSGKSTLAKLLARYIPVPKGAILLDGKDINHYNLWALRENITYVSQNEFLFTDTIYNNINIKQTRDYEEILKICKCTLVEELVSKKNAGYNMLLEENALNISGGERQRIILARTFLKESSVYILDESFSEIDRETERKILENLFEIYKNKTIIVISHRFDNNDLYDRVINMGECNHGYECISK